MRNHGIPPESLLLFVAFLCILPSCYTVRFANMHGSAEEDLLNTEEGYYRGKNVHVIDTTITLNIVQGEFMLIEPCTSGGFHSIEYKVSLGQVLLNAITFGRKRKVRVRYTCLLDEDQFE